MGRRLVIRHGERVTRHEISDRVILIGRDPGCDLFFADQKLSRRHARVEPGTGGAVLIDMGSRNGIWVNDQKVDEHLLTTGDLIRIGGLSIVFEEDPAPELAGAGDATVVLADTLKKEGGEQTAFFSESPSAGVVEGKGAKAAESAEPSPVDDTGTVVFLEEGVEIRQDALQKASPDLSQTLVPPPKPLELQPAQTAAFIQDDGARPEAALEESFVEEVGRMLSSTSLTVRVALVLSGLALLAYAMGIVILTYSTEGTGTLLLCGLVLILATAQGCALLFKKILLKQASRTGEQSKTRMRG